MILVHDSEGDDTNITPSVIYNAIVDSYDYTNVTSNVGYKKTFAYHCYGFYFTIIFAPYIMR
jgi:hypothetical protein